MKSVQLSVDENEKLELKEIQQELQRTANQKETIDFTLVRNKKQNQILNEDLKTIKSLPKDSNTWISVGKMFLKRQHENVIKDIENEIKINVEKSKELENTAKKIQETYDRQNKRFEEFVDKHKVKNDDTNKDNKEETDKDNNKEIVTQN